MKTDFLQPIGNKGKIEFGLKTSIADLDNNVLMERYNQNLWKSDSIFTNKYQLNENIEAAYINFNYQFTKETNLQAGLRYEYTQTDIKTSSGEFLVNRRYGNLFPSIFLSHKINKNNSLNFSYGRRITRPSYRDLAPFVILADINTYYYGNEKLLPTISDAVQASFSLKDMYVFSVKYSYDQNSIAMLPHTYAVNNRLNYFPENIDNLKTLSFNAIIPIEFTKWWQSQNNLTSYRQHVETLYQGALINNTNWNMQFNSSHTFKLPQKFTAELTYFYTSPSLFTIQKINSISQVTLGLQKILPNNQGTLRLNISDIFWTNIRQWTTSVLTNNLDESGTVKGEPRVIRITYNRSFGNQKVKASKKRATGSEEERQRL